MAKITNISPRINKHLAVELVRFLKSTGELAQKQGLGLYLVGGVVRDLLLGQTNLDLDLVVEGDAIELARRLAPETSKIRIHQKFGTATIHWQKWTIDFATARSETYARPGALPEVNPSSIEDDLIRRDFTINAMAVCLNPSWYGELLDLHGGRDDLAQKLIRILHEKSFIDDATRIWRALRYEQRLDFRIEKQTLRLLKRDIAMLDTISADRIRHELELVLKEQFPEKALNCAGELGVLARVHPSLKGDAWLAEKFEQARKLSAPDPSSVNFYLALLAYRLTAKEVQALSAKLRLGKPAAATLKDTINLKTRLRTLASSTIKPSRIYELLHTYSVTAIIANSIATDSDMVRQHMQLYLDKLRYVKTALTGGDLIGLGVSKGPEIKKTLQRFLKARLDGKVKSRREEENLVKTWLGRATNHSAG